jgi:Tol biopolymer transport system component
LRRQSGRLEIYRKNANGTGATIPLLVDDANNTLPSWSSDGRYLIYQRVAARGHSPWEIWAKPLFGDGKVFPVVQDPKFLEADAALSPDGKWLAHDSEETGNIDVYLTPFLHGGGKWQVSANGGICPRWRADGRELFYVSLDNRIMSAEVSEKGSGVVIGTVQPLFQADPVPSVPECMYDVTADGKRFVVVAPDRATNVAAPVTLVVNWPALLKKQ